MAAVAIVVVVVAVAALVVVVVGVVVAVEVAVVVVVKRHPSSHRRCPSKFSEAQMCEVKNRICWARPNAQVTCHRRHVSGKARH